MMATRQAQFQVSERVMISEKTDNHRILLYQTKKCRHGFLLEKM